MINNKQLPNLILLGALGCGKGTISNFLVKKYHYLHFSTGDMFRETLNKSGPLANKIKELMAKGSLIPDNITNQMIKDYVTNAIKNNQPFILDGYPRTINQAKFLQSICNIDKVIYIDVDKDLAIKRIDGRRNCPKCNKSYNIYFMPPKHENVCDVCSLPLVQRKDDNATTAINRFNVHLSSTAPLVDFYKKQGILFTVKSIIEPVEVFSQKVESIIIK